MDIFGIDGSNIDISNGGDEIVSRVDVGIVFCVLYDLDRGISRCISESEELDIGVVFEGFKGDDIIFDSVGSMSIDSESIS